MQQRLIHKYLIRDLLYHDNILAEINAYDIDPFIEDHLHRIEVSLDDASTSSFQHTPLAMAQIKYAADELRELGLSVEWIRKYYTQYQTTRITIAELIEDIQAQQRLMPQFKSGEGAAKVLTGLLAAIKDGADALKALVDWGPMARDSGDTVSLGQFQAKEPGFMHWFGFNDDLEKYIGNWATPVNVVNWLEKDIKDPYYSDIFPDGMQTQFDMKDLQDYLIQRIDNDDKIDLAGELLELSVEHEFIDWSELEKGMSGISGWGHKLWIGLRRWMGGVDDWIEDWLGLGVERTEEEQLAYDKWQEESAIAR